MKTISSKEKIEEAKELLEGTNAFVFEWTEDDNFLFEVGSFIDEYSVSYLVKAAVFAKQSSYGRDCDYSKKAIELHRKMAHTKFMERFRRMLVKD